MVLTRIWFWGASGIAVAIFWATGTVIFKQPTQTKGFLWTGWQLVRYICSCVLHSFSPSLSRHAAWGLTQSEWKEEWDYRLLFQLLTAASSFSSMAAKMDVLNQVNHGLVTFENPVQLLLRVIGKLFFFHLAFWYSPASSFSSCQ